MELAAVCCNLTLGVSEMVRSYGDEGPGPSPTSRYWASTQTDCLA